MRVLIVALLLFSMPSFAGEKPSGTFRPLGIDEVPSPIPPDFPCIEVWWQPGTIPFDEYKDPVSFYDAPHPKDLLDFLERARKSGQVKLKSCRVQDT